MRPRAEGGYELPLLNQAGLEGKQTEEELSIGGDARTWFGRFPSFANVSTHVTRPASGRAGDLPVRTPNRSCRGLSRTVQTWKASAFLNRSATSVRRTIVALEVRWETAGGLAGLEGLMT